MIDIDLRLTLADATRRFELAVRFATDAPVMALYGPLPLKTSWIMGCTWPAAASASCTRTAAVRMASSKLS